MRTALVLSLFAVAIGLVLSSPVKKETENTINQGTLKEQLPPQPSANQRKLHISVADCLEADCNISCWQKESIGGHCTRNGCECY